MKRVYFFLVMLFVVNGVCGQTSTQNFGAGTGSHTSATGSTAFIPNSTSGTTWARGGAVVPNAPINLVTASNPLGTTGAYVRAVASSSTSVAKFSPWVGYTGGTEFYTSFKVLFGDVSAGSTATSGSWNFYQGAGAMYSDASDFTGAQVFTGLRFTFGAGGALALTYRAGSNFVNTSLTTSSFSSATIYTVEIVGNNKTSGTISYNYGGVAQSVAVQKFDLYINSILIGDDLADALLPANTSITSGTFIGISSTSNVANIFVDDAVTYNAVPACINSLTPTVTSFSSTSGYTGSTVVITGTNFTGATSVQFGGTNAASFTVDNATQITAVVGSGASGSVSVTTPCGGTASLVGFTYLGYISNASGNWETGSTWLGGVSPGTSCADVTINAGQTVTVNAAAANCKSLQINASGVLVVSGNTLNVGCTNNNNPLNNDGTLTVSGGTLNINGNLAINAGATFNHSSGNINVDGNANGVAGNSVITTTPLVNFVSNNLNLTGGTLTIIDPHQANSAFSLQYNNSTAHVNLPNTYTIKFGDGISTETGGTNGFYLNTSLGTNGLALGNVIIEGSATGIRRNVTLFSNVCISGDITINGATGELFIQTGNTLHSGGNITVNSGAFLKNFGSGVLALQSFTNETVAANTVAQTIGGSGTFTDNVSPTANFQRLTINNSSAGGVTFSNDVQVSGILTLTTGKAIMSGTTQTMTLGFSTGTQGSLTQTGGYIVGKLKRWVNGLGSREFPVGVGANLKNAVINFTGAPSPGGTLTAQWIAAAPDFPNASPLMEGAITIDAAGFGYWLIDAGDGLTGGTYTGTFTNNGASLGNYLNTALIKRPTAGGDWILDGTHVTTSGSNTNPVFQRTGMSGFSQFGMGGTSSALPISLLNFSGFKSGIANRLLWTTSNEQNNSGFEVQRSTDGVNYTSLGFVNTQALGGNSTSQLNYTFTDNSVTGSRQYYRLRQVDIDAHSKLSNIVLIKGDKPTTLTIDGLFPNPANLLVNVLIASPNKDKVTLIVTDIAGRKFIEQVVSVETGSNTIPIDINRLTNGTYMVKLFCSSNCEKAVGKFVKN